MNSKQIEDTSYFYASFSEQDQRVVLSQEEAQHLQVLRVKEGCTITVVNGKGLLANALVQSIERKSVQVQIIQESMIQSSKPRLRLAIGVLKGRDLEDLMDLCAQVDLLSVDLLYTDFTQVSKKEEPLGLIQRMQQRAIVGLKQARKSWFPEIRGPWKLEQYLTEQEVSGLLMDFEGVWPPKSDLNQELVIFCGPEGGFSVAEIEKIKVKSEVIYLGDTRLRAKTAPFFALGMLQGLTLRK